MASKASYDDESLVILTLCHRSTLDSLKHINTLMEKIHAGDILVILPFAYVISQALLVFNIFWFFGALWTFDMYAYYRRQQNV